MDESTRTERKPRVQLRLVRESEGTEDSASTSTRPAVSVPAGQPRDPVERWDVARLVTLVPGTTRKLWLVDLVPALVALRVLVKRGRAWFGRRADIEAGLLGEYIPTETRRTRRSAR